MIKNTTISGAIVFVVIILIVTFAYPNILLPAFYVGLPIAIGIIAIMMFIAGYYYGIGKEAHSSSVTTTTTSSVPNRNIDSGRYEQGRQTEKTLTQKSSASEDGDEKEGHSTTETTTTTSPNKSHDSGMRIEKTLTQRSSKSEGGV